MIKATCEYGVTTAPPPSMNTDQMDGWTVVLRNGRRRMTVPFYMGMGRNGAEPTAAEVLNCLCMDAAGLENAHTFEEWAAEYGYDEDSRTAEATFRLVERSTRRLRQFLGDDFKALIYADEDDIARRCAA